MDIERLSQIGSPLDNRLKKKKDTEKSRSSGTDSVSFGTVFDRAADDGSAAAVLGPGPLPELDGTESIEGLLDDVHQAGDALKKDPVLGPLDQYKTAVRRFLRYVIEYGLEAEETTGIRNPRTMQQKKYVVIRIVDDKLERLAAEVLKGQQAQLDILRRIDEIHGLLVDLTG